ARRKLLGPADQRLPDPLAAVPVEGREDLAAEPVEDGEAQPRGAGLGDRDGDRVEGAGAARRDPEAGAEAARGGDPDPQPGEGARSEPDRDQVDPRPAAGGLGGALDLGQQAGRVPGPPSAGEPQQRLVQDLAVAPGAGGGVGGRGVEADEEQLALDP